MKSFSMFLNEGRDAPLYHGTSMTNATRIIDSDVLEARETPDSVKSFTDWDITKRKVISTSRSYKFSAAWNENRGAVFELDQRVIAQTNRIVPYNFFNDRTRVADLPHNVWINQHEEAIVGNLNPLSRYLLRIIISSESIFDYWTNNRIKGGGGTNPNKLKSHPLLYDWKEKKWVNR